MPSTNTTAEDSASVLTTTRTCNDRRHSSPNASDRSRPNTTARPSRPTTIRTCRRTKALTRIGSRRTGLVPNPADGQHDLRVLGVLLHLRAQPLHVHVHQPRVGRVPVAPHLLQQDLA